MPYFLVLECGNRRENAVPGFAKVQTYAAPVAVFKADNGEDACRACAAKTGRLTQYFAVEGVPWGIEMISVENVEELGAEKTPENDHERRMRELEMRTHRMEREAGLDDA